MAMRPGHFFDDFCRPAPVRASAHATQTPRSRRTERLARLDALLRGFELGLSLLLSRTSVSAGHGNVPVSL